MHATRTGTAHTRRRTKMRSHGATKLASRPATSMRSGAAPFMASGTFRPTIRPGGKLLCPAFLFLLYVPIALGVFLTSAGGFAVRCARTQRERDHWDDDSAFHDDSEGSCFCIGFTQVNQLKTICTSENDANITVPKNRNQPMALIAGNSLAAATQPPAISIPIPDNHRKRSQHLPGARRGSQKR
jgi:hypothetical protein